MSQASQVRQFLLPDLGEGLEEAQLVQWLVQPGEMIALNQPLCQVETAKALVDIPSPFAGIVRELHAQPGETVAVGAPLIAIEDTAPSPAGEGLSGGGDGDGGGNGGPVLVGYGAGAAPQTYVRRSRRARAILSPGPSPMTGRGDSPDQPAESEPMNRPSAETRATTTDAATSHPLPDNGERAGERGPSPTADTDDEERISTIGVRKAIAAKMVRAASIPHFTEYGQFDASALVALRERLRGDAAYAGLHLTFLPFFVAAVVRAVQQHPLLNSRWDEAGNAIVVKRGIHMGIATDTPRGLLVPVIRDAHTLDLRALAAASDTLVTQARAGTLAATAMTGSTITITNVGAAGPVDTGAPLINAPEAAIVGFGAIKPRPTVVGDHLAVRPGAWISVACDHRIVDGATAARFFGVLVEHLEAPEGLVE